MEKKCILLYGLIILGISFILIDVFYGWKLQVILPEQFFLVVGICIYLGGMLLSMQNNLQCEINKLATKEDIEELKKVINTLEKKE